MKVDRAAAVRAALRSLVAERGFHGTSMSAVAAAAGVATGTAYIHYASKDDLVLAAYLETKAQLGAAATTGVDATAPPAERFRQIWLASHRHLVEHPDHARFLQQVDASPYRARAHAAAAGADNDPLLAQATAPDIAALLLALPPEVLFELGIGPAIRLAVDDRGLSPKQLETIAAACWRAISRPAVDG
jgi:AcrR family transcriptional regulator